MSLRIRDVEKGFSFYLRESTQRLCDKHLLTGATQVESLLEVDIAHKLFFGQFVAGGDEAVDLRGLVGQQIGDGDFAGIGRRKDFNARRISQFTLEDRAATAIANMGDHSGVLDAWIGKKHRLSE